MVPPQLSETRSLKNERDPVSAVITRALPRNAGHSLADGALPAKTKQLIAVAVAHVTQCRYCIKGHTKAALRHGATRQELMEAIWVAAEMRAGGAYALPPSRSRQWTKRQINRTREDHGPGRFTLGGHGARVRTRPSRATVAEPSTSPASMDGRPVLNSQETSSASPS